MNNLEFRRQVLDPKSASFCAAKWYNATIVEDLSAFLLAAQDMCKYNNSCMN